MKPISRISCLKHFLSKLKYCLSSCVTTQDNYFISISFFKRFYLFFERGWEGEREGEKHQCVVTSRGSRLGTWPTTQMFALSANRTGDRLVCRPALIPLSHQPGLNWFFKTKTNLIISPVLHKINLSKMFKESLCIFGFHLKLLALNDISHNKKVSKF